ncbi:MAG TPA: hypothetical protein VFV79_02240 [Saprospiraceae bacterium]|nr:hypothetical protein [Saprospiraceae bacterium]
MKTYLLISAGITFFSAVLLQSCSSSFSELQGARMVGKGKTEFTPYYTTVSGGGDGETSGIQNQMGVNTAVGLSQKMDLRMRVENIWVKESDFTEGVVVVGAGPKLSLVENVMAVYLPVGRGLGESTSDTWEIQPTVLLTLPAVQNKLDINLTPKYIITPCKECPDFVATNLGFALSSDLSKWAFRAEYGYLWDPGESGHNSQFSVGFSSTFGKK